MPRRTQDLLFATFLRLVRRRRVVTEVEGLRFALDLGERIDVQLYLGSFEKDVGRAIDVLCRSGCCAVDVGANIGAHTIRMSRRVGSNGRVVAFEPTAYAYEKLRRNLELNASANVVAVQAAASDTNSDRQEICVRSSWPTYGVPEMDISAVPFWRLDDFLRENAFPPVELIKVDVDGHECAVLRGGMRTIEASSPVILLELGAWHFEDLELNPVALLREHRYRFWDLATLEEYPDERAIRSRLPAHDPDKTMSLNVLASCNPDAAERLAEQLRRQGVSR